MEELRIIEAGENKKTIEDDIEALLEVLPPDIVATLKGEGNKDGLLEIVLDLGRKPEARFLDAETTLRPEEVTPDDIEYVASRIGDFGEDNRAGIERTLHRISAIRNRKGCIVGLTCRVGRAVYGTIEIIRDIITSGKSVLLLGKPGVGKTTMLREVARVLAEDKRVVIVDTSNEIGGDGDIPHPAIGRARRMQVVAPSMQHAVMIEAVENHMPEVIVIDEIGTVLEAEAARTIAERGVQLVGTAHGSTLDNLTLNPTLSDLVGGIQTVTLGDEEARRRGTQKSVLERKAPPTFDVMVEIQDWDHLAVRPNVAEAVDAILRGESSPVEVRHRDEKGEVQIEQITPMPDPGVPAWERRRTPSRSRSLRIYPYGMSQSRLREAAGMLGLSVSMVKDLTKADVVMTLRNYYRKRPQRIEEAERRGIPIYVLRNNSAAQIESYLVEIFGIEASENDFERAVRETRDAILRVERGDHQVELSSQNAYVRRLQHRMAREAQLISHSKGKEPRRRVLIYENKRLPY